MAVGEPVDLGPRGPVTGVADPHNPLGAGNWTCAFPPGLLAVQVKQYEVYKMILQGPGGFFEVFRNTDWWDTSLLATRNSWDPQQPLLLRQADSVYFYWSVSTGTAPMVTMWLRYSPDCEDTMTTELEPRGIEGEVVPPLEPVMQGTFALYERPNGGAVLVYETTEGIKGKRVFSPSMLRFSMKMATRFGVGMGNVAEMAEAAEAEERAAANGHE